MMIKNSMPLLLIAFCVSIFVFAMFDSGQLPNQQASVVSAQNQSFTFKQASLSVDEGGSVRVVVVAPANLDRTTRVRLAVDSNSQAKLGSDYRPLATQSLTFYRGGLREKSVTIRTLVDRQNEGSEILTLRIGNTQSKVDISINDKVSEDKVSEVAGGGNGSNQQGTGLPLKDPVTEQRWVSIDLTHPFRGNRVQGRVSVLTPTEKCTPRSNVPIVKFKDLLTLSGSTNTDFPNYGVWKYLPRIPKGQVLAIEINPTTASVGGLINIHIDSADAFQGMVPGSTTTGIDASHLFGRGYWKVSTCPGDTSLQSERRGVTTVPSEVYPNQADEIAMFNNGKEVQDPCFSPSLQEGGGGVLWESVRGNLPSPAYIPPTFNPQFGHSLNIYHSKCYLEQGKKYYINVMCEGPLDPNAQGRFSECSAQRIIIQQ